MLADTETGSVVAAAQGGAEWGYRLLPLQLAMIPALFFAQDVAIRLGLGTGMGGAELILNRFGRVAAWICLAALALSCFGALVTELSGLAAVGQLFGLPGWEVLSGVTILLIAIVCTGTYHAVERVALAFGLCELAFLVVAWQAHPHLGHLAQAVASQPLDNPRYLYLLAANLGTSVMPWTVFYQQSAIMDKGLSPDHLSVARGENLGGAILCQIITAAVLIAACAVTQGQGGESFDSVADIAAAFSHTLGGTVGRMVFGLGLAGGSLVAAIVVCLTVAWAVGEARGRRHSLEQHPGQAPWFYVSFAVLLLAAALLVGSGLPLLRLSLAVGVLNALLLPLVLGVLFVLACRLPQRPYRLGAMERLAIGGVFLLTAALAVYAGVMGCMQ